MVQIMVSDAEIAVLGLVAEHEPVSGYRLLVIIAEWGMVEWAGLSSTSVYNCVKKLRRMNYLLATRDTAKRGKGPVGLLLSTTPTGRLALREQVKTSLVLAKEQSAAFKLALAFADFMAPRRTVNLLKKRMALLQTRISRIDSARHAVQPTGQTRHATALLFAYVSASVAHEVVAVQTLIKMLEANNDVV